VATDGCRLRSTDGRPWCAPALARPASASDRKAFAEKTVKLLEEHKQLALQDKDALKK